MTLSLSELISMFDSHYVRTRTSATVHSLVAGSWEAFIVVFARDSLWLSTSSGFVNACAENRRTCEGGHESCTENNRFFVFSWSSNLKSSPFPPGTLRDAVCNKMVRVETFKHKGSILTVGLPCFLQAISREISNDEAHLNRLPARLSWF